MLEHSWGRRRGRSGQRELPGRPELGVSEPWRASCHADLAQRDPLRTQESLGPEAAPARQAPAEQGRRDRTGEGRLPREQAQTEARPARAAPLCFYFLKGKFDQLNIRAAGGPNFNGSEILKEA